MQNDTVVTLGSTWIFDYPKEFTTLPDYTAHASKQVRVCRALTDAEADIEIQPMWEIEATDGWRGHAFDDELIEVPNRRAANG